MSLAWRIAKNRLYPPADPEDASFAGKTIIVTGSNVGLGAEAAGKFAAQGAARLILAVRNVEKGAKVQTIIQHIASDPKCKVEVWKLDMSDYNSIQSFSKRCDEEFERLDIAVLNAGVYNAAFEESKYGWEGTLQVNTLSTALLALLLLPKLRTSKTDTFTPVLQFTNSGRHYAATLTDAQKDDDNVNILKSLSQKDEYVGGKLYGTSKLFLLCFAKTLAARLQPDPKQSPEVFVFSVCPGACQSELSRDMNSIPLKIAKFYANLLFLRTTEQGSRTLVSGTVQGEKGHGAFWQNDVIRDSAPIIQGEQGDKLVRKVNAEIIEALSKDVPGVEDMMPKSSCLEATL